MNLNDGPGGGQRGTEQKEQAQEGRHRTYGEGRSGDKGEATIDEDEGRGGGGGRSAGGGSCSVAT
jgi:hypothetical protein